MKTISKIAAIALVAFAVVSAPQAKAVTIAELQAMIAQLTAQIAALSGTPSMPSATSYTFSSNLTIGSTGSAVTALQTFLLDHGFTIPAGATGYFGGQTKAALAAYQSSKGITPAVGYFGPITMSSVNAQIVSELTPATGTTTTVPGCAAGAMYSSTTGAACSTTTTGSGSGTTICGSTVGTGTTMTSGGTGICEGIVISGVEVETCGTTVITVVSFGFGAVGKTSTVTGARISTTGGVSTCWVTVTGT